MAKRANTIALQKKIIELAKKEQTPDADADEDAVDGDFSTIADKKTELEQAQAVPVPDAILGPAHVAWKLLTENTCTEEHKDSTALLALDLQHKFDKRPDKTTQVLPICEAKGNHRAAWLGGGGVGKTHTHLIMLCNLWPKPISAQTGTVPARRAITPRRTLALAAAPSTLRTVCL